VFGFDEERMNRSTACALKVLRRRRHPRSKWQMLPLAADPIGSDFTQELSSPAVHCRNSIGRDREGSPVLDIYVDADACPVKEEIFRVARRYGLSVTLVSNSWMNTPESSWLRLVVVDKGVDVVDDWIADQVGRDDIVITGDIPLAWRCLKKGALALGNTGRPFTEDNIGDVLSTRDLLHDLREQGVITSGPKPFAPTDRSRFLQELDKMIVRIRHRNGIGRRSHTPTPPGRT
jgi:uncharacterized protein YaiI (UPF0178 family)